MGMGYSANFADVIDDEHVKELCPAEHKALMDAIEASGEDLEAFAADAQSDDFRDEFTDGVIALYKALCEAFEKATGGFFPSAIRTAASLGPSRGSRKTPIDILS